MTRQDHRDQLVQTLRQQLHSAQQEIARVEEDNRKLADQVKKQIRIESELYDYQRRIDTQMQIYRQLYEVGRQLNAANDLDQILRIAPEFVVYGLNFERCLVLILPAGADSYVFGVCDGYYDDALCEDLRQLALPADSSCLAMATSGRGYVLFNADSKDHALAQIAGQVRMDEFVLIGIGMCDRRGVHGLLFAGNSRRRWAYHSRVREKAEVLVGLASYASLATAAMQTNRYFCELEQERLSLEVKVKERTRELSEAMENLKHLDVLKTQFFANVSHELRTPLTLSVGPLELVLRRGRMDEDVRRTLRTVYRNQLRLLRLINDLLDFARLEAGYAKSTFHRTELRSMIGFLVGTLQAAAEARSISLNIEQPSEDVELYLDRNKFEKILMNLLSNAFKFTADGGRIDVAIEQADAAVHIRVSDSGVGMAPEDLDRIFERFSQADSAETRQYAGTGIGLALVREMMHLHGGTVTVSSERGVGSTFTLHFRRGMEHLARESVVDASTQASQTIAPHLLVEFGEDGMEPLGRQSANATHDDEKEAEQAPHQGHVDDSSLVEWNEPPQPRDESAGHGDRLIAGARVLLVDDTADMRSYVSSVLCDKFRVSTACDGQSALELARRCAPDLIISDVMMPGMSGYELCRVVKADDLLRHTPLILMTAKADMASKIEGLEYGADDYLVKPFDPQELITRARNLITLRRQEIALGHAYRALQRRDEELQADLSQAESFQRSILPRVCQADGVHTHVLYRPVGKVGGDIYDVHPLGGGGLRVFVADATGHGVQASLRTMMIKSEYERCKWLEDPAEALTRLNEQIVATYGSDLGLRFPAVCLDLQPDAEGGALLRLANCAQPPLLRQRNGAIEEIYRPGPFVGVLAEIKVASHTVQLQARDKLYVFTDGTYEAQTHDGTEFGDDRMREVLRQPGSVSEVITRFAAAMDEFLGDDEATDDMTLMGLEVRSGLVASASP